MLAYIVDRARGAAAHDGTIGLRSDPAEQALGQRIRAGGGDATRNGKIDGRNVYVFAQDRTVLAGTVGGTHGEKISYAVENARKLGVPLIGLYDSLGARVQEGLNVTQAT